MGNGENNVRVYSVTPNHGLAAAPVVIDGYAFKGTDDGAATTVLFDVVPADLVVVVDDNTITCNVPVGPSGVVDVTVTTNVSTSVLTGGFEYN